MESKTEQEQWTRWRAVPANDGPNVDAGDWQIWRGRGTEGKSWRDELMFGFGPKDDMEELAMFLNTYADSLALAVGALKELLAQYELEEEEHGFPFNFALREAHRQAADVLSRIELREEG